MSNTYVLRDEKCDGHGVRVETLGLWDVFVMQKVGGEGEIRFGDQVALRTDRGYHVIAEKGSGGAVNPNPTKVGSWEMFRMFTSR